MIKQRGLEVSSSHPTSSHIVEILGNFKGLVQLFGIHVKVLLTPGAHGENVVCPAVGRLFCLGCLFDWR